MDNVNSILINRFFTRNTFKQIIDDNATNVNYAAAIRRYIIDSSGKTNGECISEIYQYLQDEYRNEYYYKNTLLNKLLIEKHNLYTTTALTEVPIGNSKADFILINGKAVVYEIKTELDNIERLDKQIEDYFKAFSRVVVVTTESHYEEVQRKLQNSPAGICILTKRNALNMRKNPMEYLDSLSKSTMFKILRKSEYEKILIDAIGSLPQVSQFKYYGACQELFESIPMKKAYKMFIQALKLRMKIDVEEYSSVPYELKFLIYFSHYKQKDYEHLRRFLSA